MSGVFLYKQCTSSLPLFQRNTNKQTHEVDPMLTINFVRLLVSVTLEKRKGACAWFVQKTPDFYFYLYCLTKRIIPEFPFNHIL